MWPDFIAMPSSTEPIRFKIFKSQLAAYLWTFPAKSANHSNIPKATNAMRIVVLTSNPGRHLTTKDEQATTNFNVNCNQSETFGRPLLCAASSLYFVNFLGKFSSMCWLWNIVISVSIFMKRLEIFKELFIGSLKAHGGSRVQRSLSAVGTKFPLV